MNNYIGNICNNVCNFILQNMEYYGDLDLVVKGWEKRAYQKEAIRKIIRMDKWVQEQTQSALFSVIPPELQEKSIIKATALNFVIESFTTQGKLFMDKLNKFVETVCNT